MSETVKIWIDDFKKSGRTIAEEIEDTKETISNERLWVKGAATSDEEEMHLQNIAELEEYLEWLEEQ